MARNDAKNARFVAGLASGLSVAEACRRAGVAETTGHRWLREDPTLRQEIAAARAALLAEAVGRLAAAATDAVSTLRDLLGAESEMARLGAARAILAEVRAGVELDEFRSRLEALERRLVVPHPGRAS